MLTLTTSLLLSAFLFGPGLLFRWAVGLAVEPKNLTQSRGEEVTRAVVWVTPPLLLSVVWALLWGNLQSIASVHNLAVLFKGAAAPDDPRFLDSLHRVFWASLCVLWRLYAITLAYTFLVLVVLRRYQRLKAHPWGEWFIKFALVTSPPISKWFFYLSHRFTPSRELELHMDVMTRSGTLYQGRIADFTLEGTGALQSLALAGPRRFRRHEYEDKRKDWPRARSEEYWRDIPGNLFVIPGSEIANINLRYVRAEIVSPGVAEAQRKAIQSLLEETLS